MQTSLLPLVTLIFKTEICKTGDLSFGFFFFLNLFFFVCVTQCQFYKDRSKSNITDKPRSAVIDYLNSLHSLCVQF